MSDLAQLEYDLHRLMGPFRKLVDDDTIVAVQRKTILL
jgi:hypothetical protein